MITGKRAVHREDVPDKLVIRIEVGEIVEDNEQVEQANARQQKDLCRSRDHAGFEYFRWALAGARQNL